MSLMWIIYWITRLDSIQGLFVCMMMFGIIGSIVYTIGYSIAKEEFRLTKFGIAVAIIGSLGMVFVPSTKTAYMMAGAYAAEQVQKNPNMIQMEHDIITILQNKIKKELVQSNSK